jgi:hypothetical protein
MDELSTEMNAATVLYNPENNDTITVCLLSAPTPKEDSIKVWMGFLVRWVLL